MVSEGHGISQRSHHTQTSCKRFTCFVAGVGGGFYHGIKAGIRKGERAQAMMARAFCGGDVWSVYIVVIQKPAVLTLVMCHIGL